MTSRFCDGVAIFAIEEFLVLSRSFSMLKAGDKAPDFRLKTDEGAELALADFRGRRVLLFFFPKANTSG